MVSFSVTLENVLLTLLYLLPGVLILKSGKLKAEQLHGLSTVLLYICSPCMFLGNFCAVSYDAALSVQIGIFFVVSLAAMLLFMMLLMLLFRKKQGQYRYRILNAAAVMGNTGFFGLPIIKAVLPQAPQAAIFSSVFCASMNILAWTVGAYGVTGDKKYISLKAAFLNPTLISVMAGTVLYFCHSSEWLPSLVQKAFTVTGDMSTPLCMFILGARLATMKPKELFCRPFIYGVSLCKLVLFPLFAYGLTLLLPVDGVFRASILILASTPCASVILNLAEIRGTDETRKYSANCALLSTLLCFITIPLLTLLL